ncbi:NAD-P-binding protein [Mycena pura]|uniref:NAD-P-binding protein n=1 Tax=Mycena pura TaxID=153505 RepID=A0AAD6VL92_9AGAR|nr:NAD-P-binding protein [Mycena pura]
MTTAATQKLFMSSPYFAVVGASKDQTKFGTKILQWYKTRGMTVHPVHPREAELEGIATLASVADLPAPTETSISIVTPPVVTLSILQAALPLGVRAAWIQPGAADDSVAEWIKANGMEERVIYGGACILEEGDALRSQL